MNHQQKRLARLEADGTNWLRYGRVNIGNRFIDQTQPACPNN